MKYLVIIYCFLLLPSLVFSLDKTASIDSLKMMSPEELNRLSINSVLNPDSAIMVVNNHYKKATNANDTASIIISLMGLSDIHRVNENYSAAFDYGGEALFLAEQFNDTSLLSDAYNKYGVLNYLFYQKEDAYMYLNKAIQLSKQFKRKKHHIRSQFFSMVLAHRQFNDYEKALTYLDSCYMLTTNAIEKRNFSYLESEKGIIYLYQKKHDAAIIQLNKAISLFEQINTAEDPTNDKGYLLVIYAYIAEAYKGVGNLEMAKSYFSKSYTALKNNQRYMSHKATILEKFGMLQYDKGEYKQAFEKLREAYILNEKYFSTKAISNSEFITTRNKYQENIVLKDKELADKNLILEKQNQEILRIRIYLYSGIALVLIIAITFIYRFRIQKQKRKVSIAENKQKEASQRLEHKNKELTTTTLKLIEKDEMITSLSEHLKSLPSNKQTDAILASINRGNTSLWDDFNSRFMEVNTGFYDRLNKTFPGLSPGDLKICALIKLNFSGKEMAHLLGISTDSVHKARYRLRKKMNLDRDINLTNYISSI